MDQTERTGVMMRALRRYDAPDLDAAGGLQIFDKIGELITGGAGEIDPNAVYRPNRPVLGGREQNIDRATRGMSTARANVERIQASLNAGGYLTPEQRAQLEQELEGWQGHLQRDQGTLASLQGQPSQAPGAVRDRTGRQGAQLYGLGLMAGSQSRDVPGATAATGAAARIGTRALQRTGANEAGARGLQVGNIARLTRAAEGAVPSAAEGQMRRGLSQSLANAAALANSARGGGAAAIAAQRQAQMQGSAAQRDARMDSAVLRAQEQAQARGQLTGAIETARAGDVQVGGLQLDLASRQAGLAQQMALANLRNEQQVATLNPELALRSRELDDRRSQQLLGLGQRYDATAATTGLGVADLEQAYERMLVRREMELAGINAGAEIGQAATGLGFTRDIVSGGAKLLTPAPRGETGGGG